LLSPTVAKVLAPLLCALGLLGLTSEAPAAWPLSAISWHALSALLLLGGVFGLLSLSSAYLQGRVVGLAWRLTRNAERANRVYFAIMRPGVVVHELAHAIAAALVGGRVTGFNVLETAVMPGGRGGQVRLGHVTYTIPGREGRLGTRLKDAFVGFAPLPFGILLVAGALALSGVNWAGDLAAQAPAVAQTWQFWVALVVIVEVADQIAPSSVDRRNWPAAILLLAALVALAWVAQRLLAAPLPIDWWQGAIAAVTTLGGALLAPVAINLVFGAALWLLTRALGR
jgi:hypothetical protein